MGPGKGLVTPQLQHDVAAHILLSLCSQLMAMPSTSCSSLAVSTLLSCSAELEIEKAVCLRVVVTKAQERDQPAHTYLLEVWKGKFLQRDVQDLVVVIQY